LPDGLRPPIVDDADAIAALYAGSRALDAREVRTWFANPSFDPSNDFRVVVRGGTVLGYADVQAETDRLSVDFMTADAGAGRELLDWAEERARAYGIELLRAWAWPDADVLPVLLRERGFSPFRKSLELQVPLDDAVPDPVWPNGVSVGTVHDGEERDVHALVEEAFADLSDFRPTPYEDWAFSWNDRKRLDLWFAARADAGELVGIALCEPQRADLGWIETLAVRRSWRHRGLGKALLLHSFGELARGGRTTAALSVDSENATGAVRLYESVGMRPVSERVLHEKRLSERRAF
jgi:ribosomal protein S18 acetylase RimI-like enzyme